MSAARKKRSRSPEAASGGTTACTICLEPLTADGTEESLPCGHSFHRSCLKKWKRRPGGNRCPLCRKGMRSGSPDPYVDSDGAPSSDSEDSQSSELDGLPVFPEPTGETEYGNTTRSTLTPDLYHYGNETISRGDGSLGDQMRERTCSERQGVFCDSYSYRTPFLEILRTALRTNGSGNFHPNRVMKPARGCVTSLMVVARNPARWGGRVSLRRLIVYGVPIMVEDLDGDTLLHWAVLGIRNPQRPLNLWYLLEILRFRLGNTFRALDEHKNMSGITWRERYLACHDVEFFEEN